MNEFAGLFGINAALHAFEHLGVDVLEGHIEVGDDDRGVGDGLDKFVGEVDGVEVHEPDPVESGDVFEFPEELCEPDFAVEVHAVVGGVLGDEDEFADAIVDEFAGFVEDHFDGFGDVFAAHGWDGAEGAGAVAAFGDFEVGVVGGRDAEPGLVIECFDGSGAEE